MGAKAGQAAHLERREAEVAEEEEASEAFVEDEVDDETEPLRCLLNRPIAKEEGDVRAV